MHHDASYSCYCAPGFAPHANGFTLSSTFHTFSVAEKTSNKAEKSPRYSWKTLYFFLPRFKSVKQLSNMSIFYLSVYNGFGIGFSHDI